MDPKANLREQLKLAEKITAINYEKPIPRTELENILGNATRLAELVLSLDEWRRKGGFDPYNTI